MTLSADPSESPAQQVHRLLREVSGSLGTAESLTGGRLAARLTSVPGASATYRGGVVAYATEVKISVLGVSESLVERRGVVSLECALGMARGVRDLTGSTYGVSTTGVAGPAEQEGKPVGTVYVGLCGPGGESGLALTLAGDRDGIIEQTIERALAAIVELLTL